MRKSALLLAGAVALSLSLATPRLAKAEYGWHLDHVDYFDDDGDWVEFWSDGEGRSMIFVIEDGETIGFIADGFDNPNPEEGSGSERNWDNLQDILKKHGGGLRRLTNLAGTPLGHTLLRNGNLIDPYHNPGDVGYEDGGGFGGGGGGFTPGNGSPTEQLKRRAKNGGKSKGDGDDGDDLKPGEVGLFDDDMPGPPELVNPNPSATYAWEREGANGGGARGGGSPGGGGGNAGGGAESR
ncbi:MAG: hypothetical protein HYU58_04590 [Proteobacteria bacterium]|nr:hypothetical protein [Pseudomonadota bacterium]